jgi:hypothetical protein
MRRHCLSLFALALLASLPACFNPAPTHFASLAELNSYQKEEGFVMIDHFGDAWPARILKERYYHDEVNVILANSEPHVFDEFEGYRLKVITLKGEHSAEIVVVYRSKNKE